MTPFIAGFAAELAMTGGASIVKLAAGLMDPYGGQYKDWAAKNPMVASGKVDRKSGLMNYDPEKENAAAGIAHGRATAQKLQATSPKAPKPAAHASLEPPKSIARPVGEGTVLRDGPPAVAAAAPKPMPMDTHLHARLRSMAQPAQAAKDTGMPQPPKPVQARIAGQPAKDEA